MIFAFIPQNRYVKIKPIVSMKYGTNIYGDEKEVKVLYCSVWKTKTKYFIDEYYKDSFARGHEITELELFSINGYEDRTEDTITLYNSIFNT